MDADPVILASVFVAMSYAASMPILVPFCAVQLWLAFFSDKFLLVKYHRCVRQRGQLEVAVL